FLLRLRNTLTINANRSLNEHSMVCYAASCREGNALGVIMSNTNDDEELTIESTPAFITILKTSFGDPDPKALRKELSPRTNKGRGID
ncbi:hypothetical protein Q9L58_010624, partial [Maublancomyces gigas]